MRRARYINVGNFAYKNADERRSEYWQDDAACVNAPEVDRQLLTSSTTIDVARDLNARYCRDCPVKAQCFQWAWDESNFTGVAGGAVFSGERATGRARNVHRIGGK